MSKNKSSKMNKYAKNESKRKISWMAPIFQALGEPR